jgi:hypothetical protein
LINYYHSLIPQSSCSDYQLAWTSSKQIVSFQSFNLSRQTVSFRYTCPEWLVSIGLLSSRPSSLLHHSAAFLCITFKCPSHTGRNWWQSKMTSYRGDNGWCHSLSSSIEHIGWVFGLNQHTTTALTHSMVGGDDVVEGNVPGGHWCGDSTGL